MTDRRRSLPARASAAIAALVLAACASPPNRVDPVRFSGRISVHIAALQPETEARAVSAHFELFGNATRGRLDLSTPLGTRLAEAHWSQGAAWLVDGGGGEATYPDVDALTRAVLGEALPLGALFDWLDGRPWPAAPSEALAAPEGRGFRQLGWSIDLAQADSGLIAARRAAPPVVTLRVKLDAGGLQD